MKRVSLALLIAAATAGEIPASWISAIPDYADTVTGIDVDRLRATGSHGASLLDIPFDGHRAIRYVMRIDSDLYLLKIAGDPFTLAPRGRRFIEDGREVVDAGSGQFLIRARQGTAILGGLHEILGTAERMDCCPQHNHAIANLVAAFDAWIYQPRPSAFSGIDIFFKPPPMHNLRAGVRFGNTLQARVDVETESAMTATALAVGAKLVPIFIRNAGRIEADFAASIEKYSTTSNGNTVTAEMAVAASALRLLE